MRRNWYAILFGLAYALNLIPNVFLFSSFHHRFMSGWFEQPLGFITGLVFELSAFLLTVASAQLRSRVDHWFRAGAYLALCIVWATCGLEMWVRNPLGYIHAALPEGSSSIARVIVAVIGSLNAPFTMLLGYAMGSVMRLEMGNAPVTPPIQARVNPVQGTLKLHKFNNYVTAQELKKLFYYDQESGVFIYRNQMKRRKAGEIAGSRIKDGYIGIYINNHRYMAHRLAWLYVYESWPINFIDHIDGNRTNNSISNLRQVTNAQNMQNQRKPRGSNATGYLGVNRKGDKFIAQITINKKHHHLGTFSTPEQAYAVYVDVKRQLHEFNTL